VNVARNGKFSVIEYRHACGHPGESHCQTVDLASFERLAREAACGPCAECSEVIRSEAIRVVKNADGLLENGCAHDAVAWYVHLAAEVPRSAAKEIVRRLVARRVLSEEVRT
jgi:hypothetical protein